MLISVTGTTCFTDDGRATTFLLCLRFYCRVARRFPRSPAAASARYLGFSSLQISPARRRRDGDLRTETVVDMTDSREAVTRVALMPSAKDGRVKHEA